MTWEPGQPVRLAADGYLLRSLSQLDVGRGYARWHEDPELAVALPLPQGLSTERHQSVVEFADNRRHFLLGVCKGLNEQLIGFCRINVDARSKRAHISGLIGEPRHRRQGAVKALWPVVHQFLFETLQLHKVEYEVRAGNEAALAVLTSRGAQSEVLHHSHDRLPNGQFVDVHVFGLLREEWLATPGAQHSGTQQSATQQSGSSGA
jgi:RimJ/RimL family protein N-acetyltransferase